eukprot:6214143-Pleurochrysis_carterae.AAC.4
MVALIESDESVVDKEADAASGGFKVVQKSMVDSSTEEEEQRKMKKGKKGKAEIEDSSSSGE